MKERSKPDREIAQYRPDEQKIKKVVEQGDADELNNYASELAKRFKHGLSTSQIRTILGSIQRIREYDRNALLLLRPKLAYVAGRHGGTVRDFADTVDKAILLVKDKNGFENLKNFVEAIVAYHRYYGGSKEK